MSPALFRKEVVDYRVNRLHGTVSLALPLSWQIIGFLLLAVVMTVALFLTIASYARVETVRGAVTLDTGVPMIVPSRAGTVVLLHVGEGQRVLAGAPLVQVRAEEDLSGGGTAPKRVREALAMQDRRLALQGDLLLLAAEGERGRIRAQMTGLTAELQSMEAQIRDQHQLVDTAAASLRDARRIAKRGFISRRDLESREATLLSRRQQLAQLEQLRAAKRSDLLGANRALAQASAQARAQVASAQANRAELLQQIAQADLASGYTVTAPVGGVVTALTARVGQAATSQQSLMAIVPEHGTPRVELYVPTSAAGFLAVGQDVRLAIDAFPYQRFGTITGRIVAISGAAILRESPKGPVPVYLVSVSLAQPSITAFGHRHPLLPGMTLTGRIVTERRSVMQWLLEPLFAVHNR